MLSGFHAQINIDRAVALIVVLLVTTVQARPAEQAAQDAGAEFRQFAGQFPPFANPYANPIAYVPGNELYPAAFNPYGPAGQFGPASPYGYGAFPGQQFPGTFGAPAIYGQFPAAVAGPYSQLAVGGYGQLPVVGYGQQQAPGAGFGQVGGFGQSVYGQQQRPNSYGAQTSYGAQSRPNQSSTGVGYSGPIQAGGYGQANPAYGNLGGSGGTTNYQGNRVTGGTVPVVTTRFGGGSNSGLGGSSSVVRTPDGGYAQVNVQSSPDGKPVFRQETVRGPNSYGTAFAFSTR